MGRVGSILVRRKATEGDHGPREFGVTGGEIRVGKNEEWSHTEERENEDDSRKVCGQSSSAEAEEREGLRFLDEVDICVKES